MGFQIFMTLFAGYSIWRGVRAYQAEGIDRRKLFFWVAMWLGALLVVFQPEATNGLAALLGVGRGVDAVLFLAVPFLFFLQFQMSRKVDRFERTLTQLVEELAISNAKKPNADPHN